MLDIDVTRVREDTLTCSQLIHFNNAGAALSPQSVSRAVIDHLALEQAIGGYEAADQQAHQWAEFYQHLATLLNAHSDEIAFAESATRAWEMAFHSLDWQPGDQIITHATDYVSNHLTYLFATQTKGIEVVLVPSSPLGRIDVSALEACITPKTKMIAVTHLASQGGAIQPVVEIGRIAQAHHLWYLLDACQSAGQIPLDVRALQCDFLTGTGRKFLRGPRGTGFLYVNNARLQQVRPPFVDLQSASWTADHAFEWCTGAKRFESWERFVAGQLGLSQAVAYAVDLGVDRIQRRIQRLSQVLIEQLNSINGVSNVSTLESLSGIVTFRASTQSADAVVHALRIKNINVSRVLQEQARLDLGVRGIPDLVRASVHYYNTFEEIDQFCLELERCI